MFKWRRWVGCAIAASAVVAAIAVGSGGSSAGAAQPGWTVLVYVAADNNLEPFAIPNLMQMASVGSGPGLDIEAFIDRSPTYSDAPLGNLGNWSGAKVVQVNKGSFTEEQNLGNVDSGDPATLSNFISSAAKRHPSDKLALIIWDHGAAWLGTALDEQTNHIIALPKLQQALRSGPLRVRPWAPSDRCGWCASAMRWAFIRRRNWITVGELEPGHGWDYPRSGDRRWRRSAPTSARRSQRSCQATRRARTRAPDLAAVINDAGARPDQRGQRRGQRARRSGQAVVAVSGTRRPSSATGATPTRSSTSTSSTSARSRRAGLPPSSPRSRGR
jgi:hypothetical protein